MIYSKIKLLIYLSISLTLLFAPVLLEVSPDGKTYAFSSRSNNNSSNTGGNGKWFGYKPVEDEPTEKEPIKVPEPSTLLLFGAGVIGLAALRKKFRKD